AGDVSLSAAVGSVQTPSGVVISSQAAAITPQVQSLTLLSNTVTGGGQVTGPVTLSAAAPSGGAIVNLASNSSSVSVPATVTVPAGSTSANFTVNTVPVSSTQSVAITASYGGGSQQGSLSVTVAVAVVGPPWGSEIYFIEANLAVDGQTTPVLITSECGVGCIAGEVVSAAGNTSPVVIVMDFTTAITSGNTITYTGIIVGTYENVSRSS